MTNSKAEVIFDVSSDQVENFEDVIKHTKEKMIEEIQTSDVCILLSYKKGFGATAISSNVNNHSASKLICAYLSSPDNEEVKFFTLMKMIADQTK